MMAQCLHECVTYCPLCVSTAVGLIEPRPYPGPSTDLASLQLDGIFLKLAAAEVGCQALMRSDVQAGQRVALTGTVEQQ
jgi:hypothetical protein